MRCWLALTAFELTDICVKRRRESIDLAIEFVQRDGTGRCWL